MSDNKAVRAKHPTPADPGLITLPSDEGVGAGGGGTTDRGGA